MLAFAETTPQARSYHGVADGHKDEPALVVLGSLLSGRTGRLHKSLVLDQKIATSASAGQNGMKWEGYFELGGVAKPGNTPEQVEQALYKEIEKLHKEKVGERELQKVKNRFAADTFRRLQSNFALLIQLLVADSNRGWRNPNEDPQSLPVTAEDVQRVANPTKPENRAVASNTPRRPTGTIRSDRTQRRAESAGQAVQRMLAQMPADQAKAMLQKIEQQESAALPNRRRCSGIKKLLQQRLRRRQVMDM